MILAAFLFLVPSCSGKEAVPPVNGVEGGKKVSTSSPTIAPSVREASTSVSDVAVSSNSPPVVQSVNFIPGVGPGDSLGVEVTAVDPDGDDVHFDYSWEVNGEPAGGESRLREDVALKRGDVLVVTITPFDGQERGTPVKLRREIQNVPPRIAGVGESRLDADLFSCRVQARDEDGDPLAYSLKKAPPGMSVEPSTGRIRWVVPREAPGPVPVTVSVSDGNGGEASYDLFLKIREGLPVQSTNGVLSADSSGK